MYKGKKENRVDPIQRLLEKYTDALETLDADDFDTTEAYWTARNTWSEITDDLKRTINGPFFS